MAFDTTDLPVIYGTTPIADIGHPRRPVPALHLSGCNLRCPYCLNSDMIKKRDLGEIDAERVIRQYARDGEKMLFVSGAEALFNKKTLNLLAHIKGKGMRVSLATNGTYPEILREALDARLVNHVVMDIKTALDHDRYAAVTGMTAFDRYLDNIIRSIDMLKGERGISSEFRTTMCSLYVNRDDVIEIAKYLGPEAVYTLQYYTIHQTLRDSVADMKYVIPFADLVDIAKEAEKYVLKMYVSEV